MITLTELKVKGIIHLSFSTLNRKSSKSFALIPSN